MCARLRPRTDHERSIVRVLESDRRFLTAAQVRDRLTAAGRPTRLATVYQCANRLVAAGVLERLTIRSSAAVYGLRPACRSRHRLMCAGCALVVNADDGEVAEWVARTAALHGFTVTDDSVLLSGTCAACAEPGPEQSNVVELPATTGGGTGRSALDLTARIGEERTG
ncbi:Fur family transcriptional regulator, ferric uptake regulator [Lentzea xinjiangensis]|uniref:Fur family transcriptional regulator, ferric uptake regulator n=1 Tax=Lentzea xinjiangensis TaxID=402600 RepID=A0A1H9NE55_9PSEU|nr:transcriptional repressor [Lentzea xinjiangensis]SER34208.1 Fur family transcriptional regulator, ferric uptake regulator [Lentzea xinjiangensis]